MARDTTCATLRLGGGDYASTSQHLNGSPHSQRILRLRHGTQRSRASSRSPSRPTSLGDPLAVRGDLIPGDAYLVDVSTHADAPESHAGVPHVAVEYPPLSPAEKT